MIILTFENKGQKTMENFATVDEAISRIQTLYESDPLIFSHDHENRTVLRGIDVDHVDTVAVTSPNGKNRQQKRYTPQNLKERSTVAVFVNMLINNHRNGGKKLNKPRIANIRQKVLDRKNVAQNDAEIDELEFEAGNSDIWR